MPQSIDTVVTSSDLSLDRVLKVNLPVLLVFHDQHSGADLRPAMDELARRYAGRLLVVGLGHGDAPQAASRYGVTRFPAVAAVRGGKVESQQQPATAADLPLYAAFLLGEGPRPAERRAAAPRPRATAQPVAVSEATFEREVLKADRPVLIDFWAPWCGPCRMVEPTIESLAREEATALKVAKVNVDENPGLAARFGAMSIPTMIMMQNGREIDRWVGALPANALRSRVKRWLQGEPQAA